MWGSCVIFYNGGMSDARYISFDILLTQLAEEKDGLVSSTVAAILKEILDYSVIPQREVHRSVGCMFDAVLEVLRQSVIDTADSNQALLCEAVGHNQAAISSQLVEHCLVQRVSIGAVLRAYRMVLTGIQQWCARLARRQGLPMEQNLQLVEYLWVAGDQLMIQIAQLYDDVAVEGSARRGALKQEFLGQLVEGRATHATELAQRASSLGLPEGGECAVILGRASQAEEWIQWVEHHVATGAAPALAAQVDGQLVGLVPECKDVGVLPEAPEGVVCAVGSCGGADSWGKSFAEARSVLVALPPEATGWHSIESLGWKVAVGQLPGVGEALTRSLYDPLGQSRPGEMPLFKCIEVFVEAGRNYRLAAEQLYIHENTLRNKVARFERLTGQSLSDINVCLGVLWVSYYLKLPRGDDESRSKDRLVNT